jgi:uncharacterized protein YbgA (DUF1722 family)/uncharacterized protein YbbK (DUF523 family)
MPQTTDFPRLKIVVSDCLRGTDCRYNGGHAQDDFVNKQLSKYADFYPFCPEAAVIGTPRETIRLVDVNGEVRVRGSKSTNDYTDGLRQYNENIVPKFIEKDVDGAVVKARSPSCGLERIKVYSEDGQWYGSKNVMQSGLFTELLIQQAPHLAVEEEGRLSDAWLRETFTMKVFTKARWREFLSSQPTLSQFQAFHRDHKYLLLSKHEGLYRELGALVATTRKTNLSESLVGYERKLFELLSYRTTRGKLRNTLDHIYGYFKDQVSQSEKEHYIQTTQEFMDGIVPLIAVIKVLEQFLNHYGSDYLQTQIFFNPYPADLALRSKITAFR